jgi:hypothetical protein
MCGATLLQLLDGLLNVDHQIPLTHHYPIGTVSVVAQAS